MIGRAEISAAPADGILAGNDKRIGLFGFVEVEFIKRHVRVIPDGTGHELIRQWRAEASADGFSDGIPVHGVVDGLAQVQVVLERGFE